MTGEFTHFMVSIMLLSIALLAMANFTGGMISSFGGSSLNTTNESAHDLAYLSQATQISTTTSDLQTKLESSNQSSQSGILGSLGFVSSLGIDAAKLIFLAPQMFLAIFGGAAKEIGAILPGSGAYLAPLLIIPLILICLTFLAYLLGRSEI